MIIVMKADVGEGSAEIPRIIERAHSFPGITTQVHRIQGQTRGLTEIYLLGATGVVPAEVFEEFESVEKVVRVTQKFRAIGRHDALEAASFEYRGVRIAQDTLHVFPGLCAVDTREHQDLTFAALQRAGIKTARAGAYKPRTSPYDFQGLGQACLPWLFESAGKHGIQIVTMEVTHESHIDEIKRARAQSGDATGVMLQIGTRNAQNFELLKAVGQQTELPVLFKRGMGISLEESLNACEYVASGGNRRIVFCLRGVKSHLGEPHRNFVDFAHVSVVQRLTRLPVCVDPSHSVGRRISGADGLLDIFHVTAQGIVTGANMVLVDVHPRPDKALCDGPQALLLEELPGFLEDVAITREAYQKRVAAARART
ncbi:MAG: 3-deoxy-7-phosphoheptulonate synthase [Deltaproteobacteria bacterium]|nr:3-deoxy-7-phosphoheptulonate synthase [Deltaproteobacteria bacterium]